MPARSRRRPQCGHLTKAKKTITSTAAATAISTTATELFVIRAIKPNKATMPIILQTTILAVLSFMFSFLHKSFPDFLPLLLNP